jgi:hypothetical protein
MNDKLLAVYTVEEISMALHQMRPLKTPGPDGFSSCFYQQNWAMVHPEVCSTILHFLNTGVMDDSINNTHITLIPKTAQSNSVTEFWPISLCNVIYKLITKVLANKLKLCCLILFLLLRVPLSLGGLLQTTSWRLMKLCILFRLGCGARWVSWTSNST